MNKQIKPAELRLPPQLVGVHEDALRVHATAFKIERIPPLVMASCSSGNQAVEIDFEPAAGQEMIDYVVAMSGVRGGTGRLVLEYEGKRFDCMVTADQSRSPAWVEVSWAPGSRR